MKRTLYIYALITSPILALYDTIPLYIFKVLDFYAFLIQFVGLTFNVFLFWVLHIIFEQKYPRQNLVLRFLYTFPILILIRGATYMLIPSIQLTNNHKYLAYPIISYLALNAIIMIIVQSIISGNKKSETEKQLQELKWQNTESQKQVLLQQLVQIPNVGKNILSKV